MANTVDINKPKAFSKKSDLIFLSILITLAVLTYGIFHFSAFVTSDGVRYAVGLKTFLEKGREPFNYEMSFGYYLSLYPLITRISETNLPLFLNGLSSLAGTLLLIPLYYLIKSLFSSKEAFFTGLFLLFSPPYWLLTRQGHPEPLALFFFIGSMAALNRSIDRDRKESLIFVLSIMLAVSALLMRADSLLGFLTPFGLLLFKEQRCRKTLWMIFIFYAIVFSGYLTIKWGALGYIVHPTGGAVQAHLKERLLDLPFTLKSLVVNTAMFVVGFLPVFALCLILSLWYLIHTRQWRFLLLICLWSGPTLVFMPFWDMSFSRLSVPILPPLLLAIVYWMESRSANQLKYVIPLALLILAHITSFFTRPLYESLYPYRVTFNGQPVVSIPVDFIFSDYFIRNQYIEKQRLLVRQVTKKTDRDIVIITDSPHNPWYKYELEVNRGSSCCSMPYKNDSIKISRYVTGQNCFYLLVVDWQANPKLFYEFLTDPDFKKALFHINPFLGGLPPIDLFLEQGQTLSILENHMILLNRYRNILRLPKPH